MMLRKNSLSMSSSITSICRQKGSAPPKLAEKRNTDQHFLGHARSRLDRLGLHRTMSLRKAPIQAHSTNNFKDVKMPVDSLVGILSKRKIEKQNSDVGESTVMQSQRDVSKNVDKKLSNIADSSYFSEDVTPTNCQYTKELEIRDCKAEDKLLKFPIDNEDVVWEESHIPFTDHIFLNKYLILFPPVTHRFMETVISALQNNPDLTADKKKQIIWSYLNYFNYHSELLEEDEEEILTI